MNGKNPTVISTFAGCGGSSLGYKWAGFRELLAIDFEKNACDTFRANFDSPMWQRDINTVSGQEILDFCKIKKGDLDLLDGSPPCQGFSTAGKRQVSDSRNDLSYEFIRLINELQPKVFVMENVSGMVKGKMKGQFNEILKAMKATGYNVKAKLMNAMWYEVPQSRERLIFIGVRPDLNKEPSYPKPMDKVITVREAFQNLDLNTKGLGLTPLYESYWHSTAQGGSIGKIKSAKKLKNNRVAYSLVKSEGNGGLYHPTECRKLHDKELKRLCSFPVDFKFGTRKALQEELGNAVMPKMMYHIARHIKENIL